MFELQALTRFMHAATHGRGASDGALKCRTHAADRDVRSWKTCNPQCGCGLSVVPLPFGFVSVPLASIPLESIEDQYGWTP
jgi:hypothetical protein